MREGEFGNPTPEEMIVNPPETEEKKSQEQYTYTGKGTGIHRRTGRDYDMAIKRHEEMGKSPVEEGAPRSEFEDHLVGVLKDPEMAHEVALAIKPREDLMVETISSIKGLLDEVIELRATADKLDRLPNESDSDFERRKSKIHERVSDRRSELQEKMHFVSESLSASRYEEEIIIDAFEKIRLAKIVGENELTEAAEDFFVKYVRFVMDTDRREEEINKITERGMYRDVMREGKFLDKLVLRITRKEPEYYDAKPEEMSTSEWIAYKIGKEKALSQAEEKARKILNSLGVEGADSLSYNQILKERENKLSQGIEDRKK